jgi:uncharacterized protein (TIGR00725 family)
MAYQIAVCGPGECDEVESEIAYRVGQLIAERNAVLICGGGTGVMAAAAKGARSRNGIVIGVRPDDARERASADLSAVIRTNMGEARNAIIVASADAVIAVGGSWGTLSELALAMRRGDLPVISLGGWQVQDQQGQPVPGIESAPTPEAAIEMACGATDQ